MRDEPQRVGRGDVGGRDRQGLGLVADVADHVGAGHVPTGAEPRKAEYAIDGGRLGDDTVAVDQLDRDSAGVSHHLRAGKSAVAVDEVSGQAEMA